MPQEKLSGMIWVSVQRFSSGTRGKIRIQIGMAVEQRVKSSAVFYGSFGIHLGRFVGITADLAPESWGMTDEVCLRTRLKRSFKIRYGAAIPIGLINGATAIGTR